MKLYTEKENTIIEGVEDFELSQTLECGQCFRFYKQGENDYVVVAFKKLLHLKQEHRRLIFFDCDMSTVEQVWIPYFDLERDYGEYKTADKAYQ